VSTKLDLLGNLLAKVDTLIIGGGMANTFLAARGYSVGKSLCERDLLPTAREIMAQAKAKGREFVLPVDAVVAKTFAANAPSRVVAVDSVGSDEMIWTSARAASNMSAPCSRGSRRWSGTGLSAPSSLSLLTSARSRSPKPRRNSPPPGRIITVAGGGDTVAALNAAGAARRFTYVSTAGGAFLEWLEGKPLPGVEVLRVR